MKKVISISQKKFDIDALRNEIPSNYLIIFFCPSEWIDEIGKSLSKNYINSIGSSSYKDITKNYSDYYSVSFLGIEIENVKLTLLKNIKDRIITYYKEVQSLKDIYIKDHSILLEFTDGLSLAEESVLTVLTNELKDIPVIGGSAADNGDFVETLVCINGECASNATAICMLTTPMKIDIYCENIYEPTDVRAIITNSDLFNRKINKINGQPALDYYCSTLNISKNNLQNQFISHPIARIVGDNYFITSIKDVDNTDLNVYARSFKDSYISICNPIDYKSLWNKKIKENQNKYLGGIFINCIFRTLLFENENTIKSFEKYLDSYGDFICMTSYGEQYNDSHANQTMTCCLFKDE